MKNKTAMLLLALLLFPVARTAPTDHPYPAPPQAQAETAPQSQKEQKGDDIVSKYDFSAFPNVTVTSADISALDEDELSVLYRQAWYCQAMTDADIKAMREIVSEDMIFTHMSGRQQTREEYFADVANGRLDYHTIVIDEPVIEVSGDTAAITYTSVLDANAYGASGVYRIKGLHRYERRGGEWIAVNR